MRVSHFLSVFAFISSANCQQEIQWNSHQLKTEFQKMNAKFSFLSGEIDELKASGLNRGQQMDQLNGFKATNDALQNEINTLKQQLSTLNQKCELHNKFEQEMNSMKKEMNDWRANMEQEVIHTKSQCKQREAALNDTIDSINEELLVLKRKDVVLEKSVSITKPRIYFSSLDEYDTKTPDFTWTIKDLKNKTKEENFALLSEVFPLKGYPFGAQAKLTLDYLDNLEISIAYRDIKKSGTDLNLKLIPSVYYTYKDGTSKDRIRDISYGFTSKMQYDDFGYDEWFIPSSEIVSNDISIDIQVETPEVTQQGYSNDGQLTWAVHEYHKMKKMEEEEFIFYHVSPHFYTSPKGYRVTCRLSFIGYGPYKEGLIVYIDFLTGPYDDHLSETFNHKTTVTLLHPTDPSKNIVKSKEKRLIPIYIYAIDMGTHAEIVQLLDGDTLYYQIEITPT